MRIKFGIKSEIKEKEVVVHMQNVLFRSMVKMHELATINCPWDTGALRSSIILKPSTPGYSRYVLGDGVTYGIHVEFGTSPHYLNPENLKAWARRVLGNQNAAYAVAWGIAHHGTEAQPFMRPALDQVKNVWLKRFMEREFNNNV